MKLAPLAMIVAALALAPVHGTVAQDKTQAQARERIRDRDIYGYKLMTRAERNEYRERMRAAKTEEERERIRAEHHAKMKERAQARGVTLPDEQPARGAGAGPGGGAAAGGTGGVPPGKQ